MPEPLSLRAHISRVALSEIVPSPLLTKLFTP